MNDGNSTVKIKKHNLRVFNIKWQLGAFICVKILKQQIMNSDT